MKIIEFVTKRNLFILMFCIGLVQIAGYYVAGMLASTDGSMAVPQPDTLLYCQAARRIVEGHPLSFSVGTAVSSGTTSVLFPFILAIPYALGARTSSLITAGFFLNACFYLVFILSWGLAFLKWLKDPRMQLIAFILLAVTPQPAYCCMAQSDIGCWLAISGLLAASLAHARFRVYAPLLILSPWIRPEGMICVIGYTLVFCCLLFMSQLGLYQKQTRKVIKNEIYLIILAFSSIACVFIFNYLLTGHAQFSSVANKGYFKAFPFPTALYRTAVDLLAMLKEFVLGSPNTMPRGLFSAPVLSGLFFLIGIFTLPWKSPRFRQLLVMFVSCAGGILTVSYSGWQDTNMDRYIAWAFPLLVLFTTWGCITFSDHLPLRSIHKLPAWVLVFFSICSSVVLWCIFYRSSTANDLVRQFAKECESILPSHASLGGWSSCGISYHFSPRRFANISGIYSPEFQAGPHSAHTIAILKYEPSSRFDYWIGRELGQDFVTENKDNFLGKAVAVGPDGYELRKACWECWNRPPDHIPQGVRLVAQLRAAYEKDEKRFSYEAIDRYGRPAFHPFIRTDELNGTPSLECGRVLVGGDTMSIPLSTNQDLYVVMRTLAKQKATSFSSGGGFSTDEYAFGNPLSIRLKVDCHDLGITKISYATNGFSDVSFKIPAEALTQSPAHISFLGDHITCGYWFYQ